LRGGELDSLGSADDVDLGDDHAAPVGDRRSRIVLLTDKGIDAIRSARRHINDIEREYSRKLGSDAFQTLCDLLTEIQPPAPSAPPPGSNAPSEPGLSRARKT
jgi:hypothetical protein